jgi:hypothetical protein
MKPYPRAWEVKINGSSQSASAIQVFSEIEYLPRGRSISNSTEYLLASAISIHFLDLDRP